jgi:hypothetical protein
METWRWKEILLIALYLNLKIFCKNTLQFIEIGVWNSIKWLNLNISSKKSPFFWGKIRLCLATCFDRVKKRLVKFLIFAYQLWTRSLWLLIRWYIMTFDSTVSSYFSSIKVWKIRQWLRRDFEFCQFVGFMIRRVNAAERLIEKIWAIWKNNIHQMSINFQRGIAFLALPLL